jgi:valyl-tRNA synthetase
MRRQGRAVAAPAPDHAGIATQMVVERQLMERQEPGRRDMGARKFLERVWAWKAESGGTITRPAQAARRLVRLVARALHHGRGPVARVLKVFVALYNEGLIYKDKRLVNWDPKLLTAISDLEVQQVEVKGPPLALSNIRSRARDEGHHRRRRPRPETMLGDVAVAVHPGQREAQAPDRQDRRSCRWSAAAFPSSATTTPIRRRAPAR